MKPTYKNKWNDCYRQANFLRANVFSFFIVNFIIAIGSEDRYIN